MTHRSAPTYISREFRLKSVPHFYWVLKEELMKESNKYQDAVGISSVKRELLTSLLAEDGIELSRKIPKRQTSGPSPLSFAQQRLWFIEQLEPGNAAYNIPGAVRLEGRLDLEVLERVINEIVRRHEI